MKIQILDKAKKKRILEGLEEFGIKKIPELLVKTGNERIRAYSGNLSTEEIMSLWRILPFEGIGLYIGKEIEDRSGSIKEIRLSVDGIHTYRNQIDNKIITLTQAQEQSWFNGRDVILDEEQLKKLGDSKGFFIIQSYDKKDFLGTGKLGERNALLSYLPKERRRKVAVI